MNHVALPVRHACDTTDTRVFDTEMLALNVSGAGLPGGVMLRESPTLRSTGKTTIQKPAGGGVKINSFFDVFTEVSLDGGQTWSPVGDPTRVELTAPPAGN